MNVYLRLVNLTQVKSDNKAWFYSKVTVSSCAITSVQTQNTLFSPSYAIKITASENVYST